MCTSVSYNTAQSDRHLGQWIRLRYQLSSLFFLPDHRGELHRLRYLYIHVLTSLAKEPLAASRDAQPSPWVSVFGVANTIWASIDFIISPVIFLAKILLSLVTTLLTPIVHLGRLAMYLALLPVRILAKFEVSPCNRRDLYRLSPQWCYTVSVSHYGNKLILKH